METYFAVKYDNEASGPFTADDTKVTWDTGSSEGHIVTLFDDGTTGILVMALITGSIPDDGDTMTQGSTTADADGDARVLLYPAYFREDVSLASSGAMAWTGPALGATHSFYYDGSTHAPIVGEILTFSGGQQCEVVTVVSGGTPSGELDVRWITYLDTLGLPSDNATFTGDDSADGALNGVVNDRAYTPLHLHRLLSDLNDDTNPRGNDVWSRINERPSEKATPEIVDLLSTITITDEIVQHMYGGSVSMNSENDLFGGLDVQVTSPTESTQPVLIQYSPSTGTDAIITDYWKNAYMPDSIAGQIRIMRRIRSDGVDIDGKRIRGALLEFGDSYFFGGTTMGTATTALALFASTDGNNATAVATVATWTDYTETEGYQGIDYNNGNGTTYYGYSIDLTGNTRAEQYEVTKYIQRRGTSETLFGRNAQLFVGINMNFAYDNESGTLAENEIIAWGTEIAYSGQTTNLSVGEVVTFSPSGAKGRIYQMYDAGATGYIIIALGSGTPTTSDTISGETSGGDGDVDTVVINSSSGRALIAAKGGNSLYCQLITGLIPVDDQEVWNDSNEYASVNGSVSTRTINNQYFGVWTGSNFQTNFGLALVAGDAIVGDLYRNLADVQQSPPNNQQGVVDGLQIGDVVTCYPWDGSTYDTNGDAEPNFDEATLNTVLVGGVTTTVDVGTGNIPENTPASGYLRVQNNSGDYDLLYYTSHDGDDEYTLQSAAPNSADVGNNVMRAFIDAEVTSGTSLSYTAVKGTGSTQVTIQVKNGSTLNGPIKPYPTTATFGDSGFSVTATRTSDA